MTPAEQWQKFADWLFDLAEEHQNAHGETTRAVGYALEKVAQTARDLAQELEGQ